MAISSISSSMKFFTELGVSPRIEQRDRSKERGKMQEMKFEWVPTRAGTGSEYSRVGTVFREQVYLSAVLANRNEFDVILDAALKGEKVSRILRQKAHCSNGTWFTVQHWYVPADYLTTRYPAIASRVDRASRNVRAAFEKGDFSLRVRKPKQARLPATTNDPDHFQIAEEAIIQEPVATSRHAK